MKLTWNLYGVFDCGKGCYAIVVGLMPKQWNALCKLMGEEE